MERETKRQTRKAALIRKRARRRRAVQKLCCMAVLFLLMLGAVRLLRPGQVFGGQLKQAMTASSQDKTGQPAAAGRLADHIGNQEDAVEEELAKLFENNEEARDFVEGYPDRAMYQGQAVDLSGDHERGKVPLLMQWDKRWGYDPYGDSIIGLSGCGPTCLAMAYLYFTGDITQNPRTMAEYAQENGYHTEGGTSWALWTDGVCGLGLYGEVLPLDENRMKSALDNGSLIVCSMRPGDFTTTGHFILISGYNEEGFRINDPNRKSNSERQWSYEDLSWQIKNLWLIDSRG